MSDPDRPEPPRPQYGEYATPEEQRARIQGPAVPSGAVAGPPPPASVPPPAAPRAMTPPRLVDRIVTFVLLGYGLFTVVSALPALADAATYAGQLLSAMGVSATLSDPGSVQVYGVVSVVTMIVLWLAAASLSWLGIRRGRRTWWIPLVAGILANLATGVLLTIPLYADPAVRAAILAAYGVR